MINLPSGLNEKIYELRSPVPQPEFEEAIKPLRGLVSDSTSLLPGMGFGEFRGTVAHREQRDLLWVLAFTLLLKESAYERLYAAGIQLPTGPAVMEDFKTYEVRPEYRRIAEIKPVKSMAIQSLEFAEASNCPECGIQIKTRPKRLFLKKTAVPADEPIFAVEETDQVIANEKFQEAVERLKFKNIAFDPVELI